MAEETEQTEDVSELRKAAEDGKSARQEADLARRELAFVKAGIDTDSKPAQALLASYGGDLSSEAIQAEAREWSLLDTPDVEPDKPDYTEEQTQQQMRDELGGEPAPDTKPELGGVDAALAAFKEERASGEHSQTDATNRAIGRIIVAANNGDEQAIFNPAKWEAKQAEAGHGAQWAT